MRYHFVLAIFASMLSACVDGQKIVLTNPSDLLLDNHPVSIERGQFEAKPNLIPLIKDINGKPIAAQPEDVDADGSWDVLTFQYSLKPNEIVNLSYELVSPDAYPTFESRTNIHLGYSPERNNQFQSVKKHTRPKDHVAQSTPYLYQYEGPGWESDLVAFRGYFDSRNGKDIFGKTKPQLYVDSIGLGEDYHTLQDWGMDILKVGSSLGSGALALLKNDSLYRLTNTETARFEVISNGPVKSEFKLTYEGWGVAGTSYDLEEVITIWGGKRWYQSQIKLKGGSPGDTLVTGIVNLKNVPSAKLESPDWKVLYSHGKQSENNDFLGMGILVPKNHFGGYDEAPKGGAGVTDTYITYLTPANGSYKYLFYAGWQGENVQFENKGYFEEQLSLTIKQLNQVIEIKVKI